MAAPAFARLPETLKAGLSSGDTASIKEAFADVFHLSKLSSLTGPTLLQLAAGNNPQKTAYLKENWNPVEIANALFQSMSQRGMENKLRSAKGDLKGGKYNFMRKLLWDDAYKPISYKSGVLSGGLVTSVADGPVTKPAIQHAKHAVPRPSTPPDSSDAEESGSVQGTPPGTPPPKLIPAIPVVKVEVVDPPKPAAAAAVKQEVSDSGSDSGGSAYNSVRGSPPRTPPESPKSDAHPEITPSILSVALTLLDRHTSRPFLSRNDPKPGWLDSMGLAKSKPEEPKVRWKRRLEEPNDIKELSETLSDLSRNGLGGLTMLIDLKPVLLARRIAIFPRIFLDVSPLPSEKSRWLYLENLYDLLWSYMPSSVYVAPSPHSLKAAPLAVYVKAIVDLAKAFVAEDDRLKTEQEDKEREAREAARLKTEQEDKERTEKLGKERAAREAANEQEDKERTDKLEKERTDKLKKEQEDGEAARLEREQEERSREERAKSEQLLQKTKLDVVASAYLQHMKTLSELLQRKDLQSSDAAMVSKLLNQSRQGLEALGLALLARIQPLPKRRNMELLALVYASQH